MTQNDIADPRINAVIEKVRKAARDSLGNKLDKIILYGSYARGDYDNESDIDFFILAHVPQEEAGIWRRNIRTHIPYIDMDYDLCVSLHVTGSTIFSEYANTLPFYMNIIREGVLLDG